MAVSPSPLMWWYEKGNALDSIQAAVERFKEKTGQDADTVWINSRESLDNETVEWIKERGMTVKTGKYVLEQHFRIGKEGERKR